MRYPTKHGLWEFINRHIKLTGIVRKEQLDDLKEEFFFVGSDCVWNCDAFSLETAYLFDFTDNPRKKENYASSFVCDSVPEKQKQIFKKYLLQFTMLSVREEGGKN